MENRKMYIDKLATQLKAWDDDIQKFEIKAKNAASNLKTEMENKITEMRVRKTHFENQLNKLIESSDEAWTQIKSGIEKAEINMKKSVNNAKEKFLA